MATEKGNILVSISHLVSSPRVRIQCPLPSAGAQFGPNPGYRDETPRGDEPIRRQKSI